MPRHFLFISIDTLRADHLGHYGYVRDTSPQLDDLASRSVVFERAIAQWPKTGTSFASMFTGQYPQTTGLTHRAALRIPDNYMTLPELLQRGGFTNVAVVSNGVLGKRLGWDAGFIEYEETWAYGPDSEDPVEYRKGISANMVNRLALPLLERHKDAERVFAWIHYSDPHAPYLLPEGEENPFVGDEFYTEDSTVDLTDNKAAILGERRDLKHYVAAYDANIRYMDRKIGELLAHADALGLLEDALVVVTADHGESLGEHDYYFSHGRMPYNNGVHVPLLISYPPALQASRVAQPVELVDLFPTLSEWLVPELPPVPGLEGASLRPFLHGEDLLTEDGKPVDDGLAFSQAGGGSPKTHFRTVQDDDWKLIFHPRMQLRQREIPARWELYHLDEDPDEERNLATGEELPNEARRLHRELQEWMKGSDWIERSREEMDAQSEETRRILKALGYIDE